jgi:hypothetical protein
MKKPPLIMLTVVLLVAVVLLLGHLWHKQFLRGELIAAASDHGMRYELRALPDDPNPLYTDGHVYSLEVYFGWVLEAVLVCRADSLNFNHQKCSVAVKPGGKADFDLEGTLVTCEQLSGEGWRKYQWNYVER